MAILRKKSSITLPNISEDIIARVANGSHHDPHSLLGIHPLEKGWVVRTLKPLAKSVSVVIDDIEPIQLEHLSHGIWQGFVASKKLPDYRISAKYEGDGDEIEWRVDDPYRHLPTIGELDLHLISEGRHEELWLALGSHVTTIQGASSSRTGTKFAVWAPNAQAVRVVGDFNHWNGVSHAMRVMGASGVWEIFIPGIGAGTKYKYEILTKSGNWITKIDPLARATELPPATASVVAESTYQWKDADWIAARSKRDALKSPMSIYELHAGSWRLGLDYRTLADQLIPYVKEMGFTHVEFMPLAEHPYAPSWGYQVTGYYAPTSRFGSMDDLKFLIDRLHEENIGVIIDWVPAHFPKDEWALGRFDGQALYEHVDPRRGEHPDWGTYIFDFGRNEVKNFLVANALYWLEEFHVDALRVDAVASMLYLDYSREGDDWLPNQYGGRENLDAIAFMQEVNATAYRRNPGIMMIAEESTSWGGVSAPTDGGGLGFGFKWNMGWMNDTLQYIEKDPAYRKYHHGELTFSMLYAYDEKFILPISHDEVVHGKGSLLAKMPGDRWQQLANVRAYLARLNKLYVENASLWQLDHEHRGFVWIDGGNADDNVLSFLRFDENDNPIAVVINFAGHPHHNFRLGLPKSGTWTEILNTDAIEFGGSGVGNFGAIKANDAGSHGQPHSAVISVPPLGAVWFKPAI
jgi:1,4-alpha-glucan branching enzyme